MVVPTSRIVRKATGGRVRIKKTLGVPTGIKISSKGSKKKGW